VRLGHNAITAGHQIENGQVAAEAVGAENATYDGAENAAFYKQDTGQPLTTADQKQLNDVPTINTKGASADGSLVVDDILKSFLTAGTNNIISHVPFLGKWVDQALDKQIDLGCTFALNQAVQYGIAGTEIAATVIAAIGTDGLAAAAKVAAQEAFKMTLFVGGGELAGEV